MNHSKTGLNAPFYQWLDDVRRAMRKEKELQEKLKYYNVKLIGYKGVVYDRIGPPGNAGNERDLFYWLDKITNAESQLTCCKKKIEEYNYFCNTLTANENDLVKSTLFYMPICQHSKSYYYTKINHISKKWGTLSTADLVQFFPK